MRFNQLGLRSTILECRQSYGNGDDLFGRVKSMLFTLRSNPDWAHHVRLGANDQRHADKNAGFPTKEDAEKSIEFTEHTG
jgi:hypothetical protein